MTDVPLLRTAALSHRYGRRVACAGVELELYPGEVLGVVGESGAGKSTLLNCVAGQLRPTDGTVTYTSRDGRTHDLYGMGEADRRMLMRTDWALVRQNPRDGLHRDVSAGGNVGDRLMQTGARHYGRIRAAARTWLDAVEVPTDRMDDLPDTFSGGMQQRLQLARNLVTQPRLLFLDEPTGGLDVSVQARLLDLLRRLTAELGIAVMLVTHDLAVIRLLADRLMVMRHGRVLEDGLTDQVLDDPQQSYTQLLVSSILRG